MTFTASDNHVEFDLDLIVRAIEKAIGEDGFYAVGIEIKATLVKEPHLIPPLRYARRCCDWHSRRPCRAI